MPEARLLEIKHEMSYLKSKTELLGASMPGRAQLRATVQDADTVKAAPFAQTAPTADTLIVCAQVTPTFSGVFLVNATLSYINNGTQDPVNTVKIKSSINAAGNATVLLANATPCGTNCFFATANGTITLAGVTNTFTHSSQSYDEIPIPQGITNVNLWESGPMIIRPTPAVVASGTFTLNRSMVVGLTIATTQPPDTTPVVTTLSATFSVVEVRGF